MAKNLLIGVVSFAVGTLVGVMAAILWERPADDSVTQPGGSGEKSIAAHEQSISDRDERIVHLQQHLDLTQRELAEQRQLLRPDALKTGRSLDELLALFPAPFPRGDWTPAERDFEDCWFESVDGLRLHGWYLPHEKPHAAVLFAHGNAGNVAQWAGLARNWHDRLSVSVFVFDYRGYGRSEGVPTVAGLVRDARAARDYLAAREQLAPQQIVLWGRSLGGAIVVELAGTDGARGLILESTFSSLRDVATSHYPAALVHLLVADRLNSAATISRYHGPLLQSHGDADRTIPYAQGRKLFESANEPKAFVRLPELDHNDPPTREFDQAVESFFQRLEVERNTSRR